MNYRHAYHAGNFADVVKHAVLCRVLAHLRDKPGGVSRHRHPCRRGRLRSRRRGGRQDRRMARRHRPPAASADRLPRPVRALLAPYLDAVAALNPSGAARASIPARRRSSQALLRPQDRLIACELEPRAAAALAHALARRQPRQGDRDRRLDRAQRLRAAEGTARPRADRSAVRAAGRIFPARPQGLRPRIANGRPAVTCSGIRSRTPARSQHSSASFARSASEKCCEWN